jgi:hypothetical protein
MGKTKELENFRKRGKEKRERERERETKNCDKYLNIKCERKEIIV